MSITKTTIDVPISDKQKDGFFQKLTELCASINSCNQFAKIRESDLCCKDLYEYSLLSALRQKKYEKEIKKAKSYYDKIFKSKFYR
jgi:hypothetical protein